MMMVVVVVFVIVVVCFCENQLGGPRCGSSIWPERPGTLALGRPVPSQGNMGLERLPGSMGIWHKRGVHGLGRKIVTRTHNPPGGTLLLMSLVAHD
jgi:hypothetical protein